MRWGIVWYGMVFSESKRKHLASRFKSWSTNWMQFYTCGTIRSKLLSMVPIFDSMCMKFSTSNFLARRLSHSRNQSAAFFSSFFFEFSKDVHYINMNLWSRTWHKQMQLPWLFDISWTEPLLPVSCFFFFIGTVITRLQENKCQKQRTSLRQNKSMIEIRNEWKILFLYDYIE